MLLRIFEASWQPFGNYNEDSRELGFTKSLHTVKIQENGVRPQVFTVNLSSIVNRGKNSPLLLALDTSGCKEGPGVVALGYEPKIDSKTIVIPRDGQRKTIPSHRDPYGEIPFIPILKQSNLYFIHSFLSVIFRRYW